MAARRSERLRARRNAPLGANDVIEQIADLNHELYRSGISLHQYRQARTRRTALFARLNNDKLVRERRDFLAIANSNEYSRRVRAAAREAAEEVENLVNRRIIVNDVLVERGNAATRFQRGEPPRRLRRAHLDAERDAGAHELLDRARIMAQNRNIDLPYFQRNLFMPSLPGQQIRLNERNQRTFMNHVEDLYVAVGVERGGWFKRFVRQNIGSWYNESYIGGIPGTTDRRVPRWTIGFDRRSGQNDRIYFTFKSRNLLGSIEAYSFEQHAYVAFSVCAFWQRYITEQIPAVELEYDGRTVQWPPPSSSECGGQMFDEDGGRFRIQRTPIGNDQLNRIRDLSEKLEGVHEDPASALMEFKGSDQSNPELNQDARSILTYWHEHFALNRQAESDIIDWTMEAEVVMYFRPSAFNNFNNGALEILQALDPNYVDALAHYLNAQPVPPATIDEA